MAKSIANSQSLFCQQIRRCLGNEKTCGGVKFAIELVIYQDTKGREAHGQKRNGLLFRQVLNFLKNNGLHADDKRLQGFFSSLQLIDGVENDKQITLQQFCDAISSCSTLIHKCVTGELVVPDFKTLTDIIEEVYKEVEPNKGGNNADYIPQLAAVDPEQFAISITTIDGQHFSIGDHDKQFCIRKFLYV